MGSDISSFGQISEKLIEQPLEEVLLCVAYLFTKFHRLESTKNDESATDKALLLANEICQKIDVFQIKIIGTTSKKSKGETAKRRQLEKFMDALTNAAIGAEKYDLLEQIIEIYVVASGVEKRPIRYLGVHAEMLLFTALANLCKIKSNLIEELSNRSERVAKERIDEANRQVEYLKKSLTKLKKQVLYSRNADVMLEIRVEIADAISRLCSMEALHLILDQTVAKNIGILLYDKNKSVKKRALIIASKILDSMYGSANNTDMRSKLMEFLDDMYDERHVTRIIQMAYRDIGSVAVRAIQTLGGMHQHAMLDDVATDFTCRLVFRKLPTVAREAAKFIAKIVGEDKILGQIYELRENATVFNFDETKSRVSIETLASILGKATQSLDIKTRHSAICDALIMLEKETVSVYDIKSMAELIARGEKEQENVAKPKEYEIDAACHMLLWAADNISMWRGREIDTEEEVGRFTNMILSQIDYLLLSNIPRLLSILKHTERVELILKATRAVSIDSIRGNGINLKQMQKIVEKSCEIFKITNSPRVAKAANKLLFKASSENDLDPDFKSKYMTLQQETIKELAEFLANESPMNNLSITLMKFPIICSNCNPDIIAIIQNTILPMLLSDNKLKGNILINKSQENVEIPQNYSDQNLLNLFNSLFTLYANSFATLCKGTHQNILDLDKFDQLRQDILAIFVACMKIHEANIKISSKCWISLANLISISSNDGVKAKYNEFYYEPDHMILAAMTEYLAYFTKNCFENSEENDKNPLIYTKLSDTEKIILEINNAAQLLILSCEAVFHTELSVFYLSIFGSNQKNTLLWDNMRNFIKKLINRCLVFNGKSMYYLYVKEAILTCYNYKFNYPNAHTEELQRKIIAEGRNTDNIKYYSLLRTKELMKLVLSECNFLVLSILQPSDDPDESDIDPEEKAKQRKEFDLFSNFVTDLLKESLKDAANFLLLEVVRMGVASEGFAREKLGWIMQLFNALSDHILKVDSTIKDEEKLILKEFKDHLISRAAAAKIKKTPYGKSYTKPESLSKLSISPIKESESVAQKPLQENDKKESDESENIKNKKIKESSQKANARKSTKKRIEFGENENGEPIKEELRIKSEKKPGYSQPPAY